MAEGRNVEQLMGEVDAASSADSSMHEEFWKGERPHVFSLVYLFPFPERRESEFEQMSRGWDIESMFEIRSQRKLIGPLVVFAKKTILSLTRWYMNPVVYEVKRSNMLAASTLRDLNENLEAVKGRLATLEQAEKELRRRLDDIEKGDH